MEDTTNVRIVGYINGVAIRQRLSDDYWSLTDICKAGGKFFGHYADTQHTKDYMQALSAAIGIPIDGLFQQVSGVFNSLKGTWGHELIAMHVAAWVSPDVDVKIKILARSKVQEFARQTGRSFHDVLFSEVLYEGDGGKRTYKPFDRRRALQRDLLRLNYAASHGILKSEVPPHIIRLHGGGPIPNIYKQSWIDSLTLEGYDEAKRRKITTKAKAIASVLQEKPANDVQLAMWRCAEKAETIEEFYDEFYDFCGGGKLFVEEIVDEVVPLSSYHPRRVDIMQMPLFQTEHATQAVLC